MAIRTTNNIYISDRLKEKLTNTRNNKFTFVHAPVGYGKTIVIRNYLRNAAYDVKWMNCDTTKELFWNEFCEVIAEACDVDAAPLIECGFPKDIKDAMHAADYIATLEFRQKLMFVFDNYNVIDGPIINKFFFLLRDNDDVEMNAIFITGNHLDPYSLKLIVRNWVNYINDEDFSLHPEDIRTYFRNNGITITRAQASELYAVSRGWPIIVSFQLMQYKESHNFNITSRANTFINNEIFFSMPADEKMFLVKMSAFESFTLAQAAAWNDMSMELAKSYIEDNIFVRYNSIDRVYSMNPLIRKYLEKGFNDIPVFTALVAMSIPPILTNAWVGIYHADRQLCDAAKALGMTPLQSLWQLRIPLAAPLILAGLRTALVQLIATAVVAAYAGLGGLGRFLIDGLGQRDIPQVIAGSLVVSLLAIGCELLFSLLSRRIVPAPVTQIN